MRASQPKVPRCIADDQSPPAKRHKPLPAPTTTKPAQPLPVEVLHRIVQFIHSSDKRTLGRLMRVSPPFNAIVAPKLYHTVHIAPKHGYSDPYANTLKLGVFDVPVKKAWMKKSMLKQKTQGKEEDLRYIRRLFFEGMFDSDFTLAARSSERYSSIKSVRFRTPSRWSGVDDMAAVRAALRCFCGVEKVVYLGCASDAITEIPTTVSSLACSKVVVLMDYLSRRVPPLCSNASVEWPGLKTIVYVFQTWTYETTHEYPKQITRGLAKAALRAGAGITMLIVNADLDCHTEGRNFREDLEEHIARLMPSSPITSADPSASDKKDWPQYCTVKHLTVREYFRDYDWAGEFTEWEARDWLKRDSKAVAGAKK